MAIIQNDVNEEAKSFGIKIVDVRIKRADLPQANSDAIYKRMQTERQREAKEFRAEGAEIAAKITSTADKDVTVLLANANKQSQNVNAGPKRTELMSKETIDQVLAFIEQLDVTTLDLTGGAPEMNPHFKYFVIKARAKGLRVIDRCNLGLRITPFYRRIILCRFSNKN